MRVLITGASRGVGKALAEAHAARGDQVTGTARNTEGLLPLDLSDTASIDSFAERIAGDSFDLLVCNAGIYPDKGQRLDDGYPPEMWAEAFAVNVTGVFRTIQAALPALRRAGNAKIAILSSQMASQEKAPGGSYIYRASKAAVLNLGRNLAQDLKPENIAVGIYHPGWVRTNMGGEAAALSPEEAAAGLVARFDALSPATTGCFETWDGRPHAL